MEVGIEDCLHIEFEYDKGRYHLRDTVVGKIYFLLVRIKLKHMEVRLQPWHGTADVSTLGRAWPGTHGCQPPEASSTPLRGGAGSWPAPDRAGG